MAIICFHPIESYFIFFQASLGISNNGHRAMENLLPNLKYFKKTKTFYTSNFKAACSSPAANSIS